MNIYADKSFLPENVPHAPMLYPFWGFRPAFGDAAIDRHRFEHYLTNGADLFNVSGLGESRLAVLPFHWEQIVDYDAHHAAGGSGDGRAGVGRAIRMAEEFAALAAGEGKTVLVFFAHDSVAEVPLGGSTVFRTSLAGAARRANEYAMPSWMPDEVEASFGGELPVREKVGPPVVGFCGYNPVRLDARARLRHGLGTIPGVRGVAYRLGVRPEANDPFHARAEALEAVARSRAVRSNFVFRDAWFNGALAGGRVDRGLLRRSRRQFVENLFGSDYVLCTRGNGNYSIRFYEALSGGRIPVFVNTDCVLPFEEWIDWKQHCVWVEQADISRVADRVAEFHEALSPGEFVERQRACRRLWLEWLSPHGFFKNLRRYFG